MRRHFKPPGDRPALVARHGQIDVRGNMPMAPSTPTDIGHCVAWLCSDYARLITGCDFVIDGGARAKYWGYTRPADKVEPAPLIPLYDDETDAGRVRDATWSAPRSRPGPLAYEIRELPRPRIGDDDGLLRIEACGVCGSTSSSTAVTSSAPACSRSSPGTSRWASSRRSGPGGAALGRAAR